jgi:hypothetical protein
LGRRNFRLVPALDQRPLEFVGRLRLELRRQPLERAQPPSADLVGIRAQQIGEVGVRDPASQRELEHRTVLRVESLEGGI